MPLILFNPFYIENFLGYLILPGRKPGNLQLGGTNCSPVSQTNSRFGPQHCSAHAATAGPYPQLRPKNGDKPDLDKKASSSADMAEAFGLHSSWQNVVSLTDNP